MLVTVRQLVRKELYRDMTCIFDDDKRLSFVKEHFNSKNYIKVAEIELVDNVERPLSLGFELTNSIENSWYKNPYIKATPYAKEGCRSTSVGDVIQMQGKSFMVAGCGFTEII